MEPLDDGGAQYQENTAFRQRNLSSSRCRRCYVSSLDSMQLCRTKLDSQLSFR
ncbi:hypothetical protein LINGRAHAP2_LOCUS22916 [Linum grandiflorum]